MNENLLTKYDLFYPTSLKGFTVWGKSGLELLENIKKLIHNKLKKYGYLQIKLPTISKKKYLDMYVGNKKNLIMKILSDSNFAMVLNPFSEFAYLEFLTENPHVLPHYKKVFQWSKCYLNEQYPNLCINCLEITKCEIFSIDTCIESANILWDKLNDILIDLCRNEFCLSPIYGIRPKKTAFPFTYNTFSAEIALGDSCFQTLLVSHIMENNFLKNSNFLKTNESNKYILNSACFSQKMIASMLLHHSDALGLRYPSSIAPTRGIIVTAKNKLRLPNYERVKYVSSIEGGCLKSFLISQGLIWLIFYDSKLQSWKVMYRNNLEQIDIFSKFEEAYDNAVAYEKRFDDILRGESKLKNTNSMIKINCYDKFSKINNDLKSTHNIFVFCCDNKKCSQKILSKINWIPKLKSKVTEEVDCCIECGHPASWGYMFEKSEKYTSFYVKNK